MSLLENSRTGRDSNSSPPKSTAQRRPAFHFPTDSINIEDFFEHLYELQLLLGSRYEANCLTDPDSTAVSAV